MSNSNTEHRHLHRIENLMLEILNSNSPTIVLNNFNKWENVEFTDRLSLKSSNITQKHIRFNHKGHRATFTIIIHLLAKIYKMILMKICAIRRELYYEEVNIFQNQQTVDTAIQVVCCLLGCPPWDLGVMATSKGLVAGPLLIRTKDDVIDCSSPGGTIIPFVVCLPSVELRSAAKLVLLVEKDTIFQKLLGLNILEKMCGVLLITGKGFPDVNTRMLVRKLNQDLKLPVVGLFDADPFGIAIMCVYKYGSLRMSPYSESLATPEIKWVGIHPTDIQKYQLENMPLNETDRTKLKLLHEIGLASSNEKLLKQIRVLTADGRKSEIEALCKISPNYLIDVYIPYKIMHNRFIQ